MEKRRIRRGKYYLSYAQQENEPAEQESSSEEAAAEQTADAARADLSFMQWYAGDLNSEDSKAKNYTTPLSPTSSYSLEVPGWQEGHADANAPANASGTICVMDSGVDTNHPDLQGVLYEFTPEQQARYGCGKYGMNASGDGDPENEPKVVASHGTHVAGIIAANWNGDGISGVANGVKIFSVNVFGAGAGSGVDGRMIGLGAIGLAAVLAATLLRIRKKGNRGA